MEDMIELLIAQGHITREEFNAKVQRAKAELDAIPKNPDDVFKTLDYEEASLDDLKIKKIEQLDYLCNQAILGGFKSSCLGSEHDYEMDMEAQQNMSGQLNFLNAGLTPSDAIITWKASGVPAPHTVEQFKQMCVDAFTFKQNMISKYWTKKYSVSSITTKEEVLAVEWNDE